MVSAASLIKDKFEFHSDNMNGKFSGMLAGGGKSITGEWIQGGSQPFTLYWSEQKPARE